MNILVTGASGFIGKRLIQILAKKHRVICLTAKEIEGYECILHYNYSYDIHDMRRLHLPNIDVLLHLGGQTPKRPNDYLYVECYMENIRTTSYLLGHLPNIPRKIVYASSVDVYRRDVNGKINEDSPIQTESAYGLSKFLGEKLITEYAQKNQVDYALLRMGNIYGPGEEKYEKIVSSFVKRAIMNSDITIDSNGLDTRSMLYIEDCCLNFQKTIESNSISGIINLVPSASITIKEIAQKVIEYTNSESRLLYKNLPKNKSPLYDNSKYSLIFGNEKTSYDSGIRAVADHLMEHYEME